MATNISTKMATQMATVPQLSPLGGKIGLQRADMPNQKNKFDSTNAQQSSDSLITAPSPKDEFNAAV